MHIAIAAEMCIRNLTVFFFSSSATKFRSVLLYESNAFKKSYPLQLKKNSTTCRTAGASTVVRNKELNEGSNQSWHSD